MRFSPSEHNVNKLEGKKKQNMKTNLSIKSQLKIELMLLSLANKKEK